MILMLVFFVACGSEEADKGSSPEAPPAKEKAGESKPEPAKSKVDLSAVTGSNRDAMQAMIARNGSMKKLFEEEHGFAIFPGVGKGGFVVGGGGGSGSVYEQGKLIGTAKVKFLSVGAQVGGQSFIEVIFFENRRALDRFKSGNFEFGAQATAVAVTAGAAADADYEDGVAVFTMPKKGLMAEASISGQKFEFRSK